jgi:phenylalanyl-tRNA synthetase beta chain
MTARKVAEMLRRAGHEAEISGTKLVNVRIPCYRIDVMHPVDLVEDVAVAYGYNNIKPVWRELPTSGGMKPEQGVRDISRELMVGMGFQEVLTFTLTNSDNLFAKMNCGKRAIVEISNPKVSTLSCLRNWLLPSLVEFVSNNLHVECPQKIFEVGKVTLPDHLRETMSRDEYRLAAVIYDANASFTEAKATVEAFMRNLGFKMTVEKTEHSTFLEGRVCKVCVEGEDVGFLGEVHPGVLENWGLENPVSALELNIEKIISLKQSGSAFL